MLRPVIECLFLKERHNSDIVHPFISTSAISRLNFQAAGSMMKLIRGNGSETDEPKTATKNNRDFLSKGLETSAE